LRVFDKAKTYGAYLPDQVFLLPPSLKDCLPEDHLAYFVSDVVDQLDLSAIESVHEKAERRQPPYHPRMMTKVLINAYCVAVFFSRRMEKGLQEVDRVLQIVSAGLKGSHCRRFRMRRTAAGGS
jgi:transposase